MLVSMNWVREYVDLNGLDIDNLIYRFTMSTAEVEDVFKYGKQFDGVVSAKITKVLPHPNSSKLHLLELSLGASVDKCVCGAPNVREGMIVPFARLGARVGDLEIKKVAVAGVESSGMCCSALELGLGADDNGLMELPNGLALGKNLKELFQVEDTVFEVDNKSISNRPDLWGMYGIAREFSSLSGRPLKKLPKADLEKYKTLPKFDLKVNDRKNVLRSCKQMEF